MRGIFTYKVNDAGLLTNLRGYWNMDMMKPVKEGEAISAPLSGRGAVVVGGSRGIGLAVATLLAEQGAGVVVNGRDADAAAQAAERIDGAVAHAGSPADPATADALIDRCTSEFGRIDILVNCAGTAGLASESILERHQCAVPRPARRPSRHDVRDVPGRGAEDGGTGRRHDHQHQFVRVSR